MAPKPKWPDRYKTVKYYDGGGSAARRATTLTGQKGKIARYKEPPKLPPGAGAQTVQAFSKVLAAFIEDDREKKDRANMQKALTAFRSGFPGQKERIDLSEQEIMDKYAWPAYDKVIGGPMDMDETSDDIDSQADQAFYNALPRVDKEGRYTKGKRLEGIDAAIAAAGPTEDRGPVTQEMLNTLMFRGMDRRREEEAAELKRSRGMEDYEKKKSIEAKYREDKDRKTGKDRKGILRYLDDSTRVFPESTVGINKVGSFKEETVLRKDFEKGAKDFIKVRDAYGRIQASASDPSAAGDLALIFNYMKVLDPGSTVREGEFATAAASAGIPDRIRAQYNKIIEGERLGKNQRKDFVSRAGKLYSSQLKQYKLHEDYYRGLAVQYGVNPENVVYGMDKATQITLSKKDKEALKWANENLNDSRAIEIKRRLGR